MTPTLTEPPRRPALAPWLALVLAGGMGFAAWMIHSSRTAESPETTASHEPVEGSDGRSDDPREAISTDSPTDSPTGMPLTETPTPSTVGEPGSEPAPEVVLPTEEVDREAPAAQSTDTDPNAAPTPPPPVDALQEIAPTTATELAGFLAELDDRRQSLDFASLAEGIQAIASRTLDPELARQLAGPTALALAEVSLFEAFVAHAAERQEAKDALRLPGSEAVRIVSPTLRGFELVIAGNRVPKTWRELPHSAMVALLEDVPMVPSAKLDLARFAFDRSVDDRAIALVRDALERDANVKPTADQLLAEHFRRPVPPGGFAWFRDRFLPFAEVNRRRFIEDVAEKVHDALTTDSPFQREDASGMSLTEIEALAPTIESSAQEIGTRLNVEYEPIWGLIKSCGNASTRRKRLRSLERWTEVALEAHQFIGQYVKEQQGEVDEFRARLSQHWKDYRQIRDGDEVRLQRWSRDEAREIRQRIQVLEEALDALHRYAAQYHEPLPSFFPTRTPEGILVHVLPGRNGAGLPDTLDAIVRLHAGDVLPFLQRAMELLKAGDQLTPWERAVLEDHMQDALVEYNEGVLTSADPDERACIVATNAYRRTLRLRPFQIDERLVVASRGHSEEMKRLGYFGHTSPVGGRTSPSDRVRLAGYQGGAGENCIMGGRITGSGAFEGWYHSPGHHRGLISGSPHVGVGASSGHSHFTMNMAGGDPTWQSTFVALSPIEIREIERSIDSLERGRTADEAMSQLEAMGGRALAVCTRQLAERRSSNREETRLGAASLAKLVARIASTQGLPTITDMGVRTLLVGLNDRSAEVRLRSVFALRTLAGKKLGYSANAEAGRRRIAALRWSQWWEHAKETFTTPPELDATQLAELAPERSKPAVSGHQSPDAPIKVFTPDERMKMARRLGGSRSTEKAVERSLDWLVRHQQPDGGWRGKAFRSICEGGTCPGPGNQEYDVALTGLAVLAFLNGGHTIEIGEHREVVARGVHFLLERLEDSGKFTAPGGHFMYQQAIGTQALAEAYGTSGDPFVREAAQRAVNYLLFAQNPTNGGWRYEARKDADSSVTGWCVLALTSAIKAELDVAGLRAARRYLDSVTDGSYYRVGYRGPNDAQSRGVRLTAVGAASRVALGTPRRDPVLLMATRYFLESLPTVESMDVYYAYYATLAVFQMGGEAWDTWNKAMVRSLLGRMYDDPRSCAHGSYPYEGQFDGHGGRVYATALCTLMLEVYYRYDVFPEHRSFAMTGAVGDSLTPYLETIRTGDAVAKAVAMRRVETLFGTAAQGLLLELVRTSDQQPMRRAAAEMVANVAGSSTLSLVLPLLAEPDNATRVWLERAAARALTPGSAPVLIAHLADERPAVRRQAVKLLASLGDPSAVTALVERSTSEPDGGIQGEIRNALARLSRTSSADRLLEAAGIPESQTAFRQHIREGLDLLDRNDLLSPLIALEESDPDLWAEISVDLATFHRQATVPILIRVLDHADVGVRDRSIKLLRALTGRNEKFDPAADARTRRPSVDAWKTWWAARRETLTIDPAELGIR